MINELYEKSSLNEALPAVGAAALKYGPAILKGLQYGAKGLGLYTTGDYLSRDTAADKYIPDAPWVTPFVTPPKEKQQYVDDALDDIFGSSNKKTNLSKIDTVFSIKFVTQHFSLIFY